MVVAITRPTRVIVSKSAVKHNLDATRDASHAKFMWLAVKSNAYGFGIIPMSQAAVEAGVDGLAVAILDEALAIRQAGITVPILVLGITPPGYAKLAAEYDVILTVADQNWLTQAHDELAGVENPLQINIAVDTGMNRIGFTDREQLADALDYARNQVGIFDDLGIMTHFAESDSPKVDYFHKQVDRWHELTDGLELPRMVHLANSAAALYHADEIPTDVIRAGTIAYGIEPSQGELRDASYVEPVLTLETELNFVKQCHEGDGVSYGHTYYTSEGEWIGTIPLGYGDGLSRKIQGFDVIIEGERCPLIGKPAMDQMMVALSHAFPVGTKVTVIGKNHGQENTLEDVGAHVGVTPWEVSIHLQERLTRVLGK
ncbi:alanine racemase [Weissella viridescens]|uniref:alanine racemase n=1 Tax=Weissella viridescens TaxID=1629 RepID=UPI00092F060B|nr:alanine racemase [Weissella viridescens]